MHTGKDGLELTQGVMLYVHLECLASFLERLERDCVWPELRRGATIQPDRLRFWKPEELIRQYKDISKCDQCGKTFAPTDRGYLSCWVVSLDEMAVWLSAQGREATPPPPA
jgi:hypothetical protein